MDVRKPYIPPTFEKCERLSDVTQGTPGVVTGAPGGKTTP
jgi:hypothetical protein